MLDQLLDLAAPAAAGSPTSRSRRSDGEDRPGHPQRQEAGRVAPASWLPRCRRRRCWRCSGLDDVPAYPEPAETETTFEGNALIKARACVAATGRPRWPTIPGWRSTYSTGCRGSGRPGGPGPAPRDEAQQRAAAPANWPTCRPNDERRGSSAPWRWCWPDGTEHIRRGEVEGRLATSPRGHNGFGYDPLFVPDGYSQTTAELVRGQKDAISHRGRAVRAIVQVLADDVRGLEADGERAMKTYLDLLRRVRDEGVRKQDRTGTGHPERLRTSDALRPRAKASRCSPRRGCTSAPWWRSCCGSCAAAPTSSWLHDQGVTIWDEWADAAGELGPIYGYQWRSWPTPDGRHIDQIGR